MTMPTIDVCQFNRNPWTLAVPKLLPCPWDCGRKDEPHGLAVMVYRRRRYAQATYPADKPLPALRWWTASIICESCQAGVGHDLHPTRKAAIEEAVNAWNDRP